ncbi:MAG: hypothetical protein ACKVS6_03740 [Planctomycetota bacterium]
MHGIVGERVRAHRGRAAAAGAIGYMMYFEYPLALIFSLGGVLILLLSRRTRAPRILRPAVERFVDEKSVVIARARRPPAAAWCAAAACVMASLAAARPAFESVPGSISIFFDTSIRMARSVPGGETRLARAQRAAAELLSRVPGNAEVRWTFLPGATNRGNVNEALAAIEKAAVRSEYCDIEKEILKYTDGLYSQAGARAFLFTGSDAPLPSAIHAVRFGASVENLGIVGFLANPNRVFIENGGRDAANGFLRIDAAETPFTLAAGETRAFEINSTIRKITIVPSGLDALALDNVFEIPAPGLRVEYHNDPPEPLRRAVDAAAAERGNVVSDSKILIIRSVASTGESAATPALEYEDRNLSFARAVAQPASSVKNVFAAISVKCARVVASDAWIVDANNPTITYAGIENQIARVGIDFTDMTWRQSASLPVLVSALVDAVCSKADLKCRIDARATSESGALSDSGNAAGDASISNMTIAAAPIGNNTIKNNISYLFAAAGALLAAVAAILTIRRSS